MMILVMEAMMEILNKKKIWEKTKENSNKKMLNGIRMKVMMILARKCKNKIWTLICSETNRISNLCKKRTLPSKKGSMRCLRI